MERVGVLALVVSMISLGWQIFTPPASQASGSEAEAADLLGRLPGGPRGGADFP